MEYSPQNSFDRDEHNANSFPYSQTLAFQASTRESLMEYPLPPRSSPPLLRWKSLHNLNLLDFMVVPQPRPLGTSSVSIAGIILLSAAAHEHRETTDGDSTMSSYSKR